MKMILLRGVLLLDAFVLFLLGALLVFLPTQIERAFHFTDLPAAVRYLIGMWGCVTGTMGFGYLVAAANPLRHRIWINVGIIRGLLECGLGTYYLVQGTVTVGQAGLGTAIAGLMALAYVALYPRAPRAVDNSTPSPAQP
jgi:hypothetical protein